MEFSHEIKKWIAENIVHGIDLNALVHVLVESGYPHDMVVAEIHAAQAHPYMEIIQDKMGLLAKRDSLLKTLDRLNRKIGANGDIKLRKFPPHEKFMNEYVYRGKLGRFKGAIDHWPAYKKWTPRYLLEKIGADRMVEVQSGRDSDPDYENLSYKYKKEMRFGDYIDIVENKTTNDIYMTANNMIMTKDYMKDLWADIANVGDNYLDMTMQIPETCAVHLWIGPKGTITPLHFDRNSNIFVQVYGKKRVTLIPAIQVPYMYNRNVGVYSKMPSITPDLTKFPEFAKAQVFQFDVDAGEIVFIPTGCWHYIESLSPNITFSMTHLIDRSCNDFVDYPVGR